LTTQETADPLRILELRGAYNVRDIGGYPTQDGRRTRWRVVLRSDSLDRLTRADRRILLETGIHTIVDLRREREVSDNPNVFAASVEPRYLNVSLLPSRRPEDQPAPEVAGAAESVAPTAEEPEKPRSYPKLEELYRQIVDERQEQLGEVLSALAEPGALPGLVHCTAGKDRTGIVVALLLTLAGVDRATIAEDFAITGPRIAGGFTRRLRKTIVARKLDWKRYRQVMDSSPQLIVDLLDYIDEKYEGTEPFLRTCGLSAAQIDRLREALVE
jgi:protein-tyrosine phosphatase